jgi:hypothetical protein
MFLAAGGLTAAVSTVAPAAFADDSQPAAAVTSAAAADEGSHFSKSQDLTLAADPKMLVNWSPGAPHDPNYRGGRGLITLQGMSGMFLNPTSGTLDQGQITAQYCLFISEFNLNKVVGHGLMVGYGVTDWLEVGMFGTIAEVNGVDRRWFNDPIGVGGPFARIRLLKGDGWMPELSIGGMYVDGSDVGDLLYRAEVFAAASELMPLDTNGTFKSLRFHEGIRYVGRSEANNVTKDAGGHLITPKFPSSAHTLGTDGDFCLLYGGVELELPYNLYAIGEISTNNLLKKSTSHTPWAAGVQWKPNGVLGISLAYMTPEFLGLRQGLWFGVGLNFKI